MAHGAAFFLALGAAFFSAFFLALGAAFFSAFFLALGAAFFSALGLTSAVRSRNEGGSPTVKKAKHGAGVAVQSHGCMATMRPAHGSWRGLLLGLGRSLLLGLLLGLGRGLLLGLLLGLGRGLLLGLGLDLCRAV